MTLGKTISFKATSSGLLVPDGVSGRTMGTLEPMTVTHNGKTSAIPGVCVRCKLPFAEDELTPQLAGEDELCVEWWCEGCFAQKSAEEGTYCKKGASCRAVENKTGGTCVVCALPFDQRVHARR